MTKRQASFFWKAPSHRAYSRPITQTHETPTGLQAPSDGFLFTGSVSTVQYCTELLLYWDPRKEEAPVSLCWQAQFFRAQLGASTAQARCGRPPARLWGMCFVGLVQGSQPDAEAQQGQGHELLSSRR